MRAHNIVSICVVTLLITVLFTGVTTMSVAAQPTPTIYYVPQAGSTWVNRGTAGASYNAYVSTPSLFQTQSNGHPYWGNTGQNDLIYIPAGSATNNQNVASWEIGFRFSGLASSNIQKIWDKAYGGFSIYVDTQYGASRSYLTIYRATTGGSGARWYIPTDTVLRVGHNYYIQIAWDSSAGPGKEPYPTIWIGEDGNAPVLQTHWDETGGALGGSGAWYNDAVGSANLGNTAPDGSSITSVKTAWLNGGFFVYRQYNSIIDFSSGGSWNTDKLALVTATPTTTPSPTVTPTATPAPTVTPTTTVKATTTPKATTTVKQAAPTATTTVKATTTPKATTTVKQAAPTATTVATMKSASEVAGNDSVPGMSVPAAQTSSVASLPAQPVLEFSLLGLGIPALLVGAIYLLMRKG